jgi:hypothetical protein
MPTPVDKRLYAQAKREADAKFAVHGAYKSAWLVRRYKALGGRYREDGNARGLARWFADVWVDLTRPIREGRKIVGYEPCGRRRASSGGVYPVCRPMSVVRKMTRAQITRAIAAKQRALRAVNR